MGNYVSQIADALEDIRGHTIIVDNSELPSAIRDDVIRRLELRQIVEKFPANFHFAKLKTCADTIAHGSTKFALWH
jgi:hypothetical protein